MSTPNGYKNPAYCHQYDSSVYDYQYVPEIDPDSPDLDDESNRRQPKLIHPGFQRECSTDSEGNTGSDESNGSIIIEECNNRRVTMICQKRLRAEENAAYYQDVSLESENNDEHRNIRTRSTSEDSYIRHQKPLEPPAGQQNLNLNGRNREYICLNNNTDRKQNFQRPQRQHRYEVIPGGDEFYDDSGQRFASVHRYAEISSDENGFPTLKKPIEIKKINSGSSFDRSVKSQPISVITKPRARTPTEGLMSFSPPLTPSRSHPRSPFGQELELGTSQCQSTSPSHLKFPASPVKANTFEMAELSPPRSFDSSNQHALDDQTFFMNSPKRQPPIGASPANEPKDPFVVNTCCVIPVHLQKHVTKRKERAHSAPNSPKRMEKNQAYQSSPCKSPFDRKVMQIFHVKSRIPRESRKNSVRRNISSSFTDPPVEPSTPKRTPRVPVGTSVRSPYKPTTMEIVPSKTAVITPIFQRKNHQQEDAHARRNLAKMSHNFQSTGNLCKSPAKDRGYPESERLDHRTDVRERLKRNQSVPNFAQTFTLENGLISRKPTEPYLKKENIKSDFQYSPVKKPVENFSPINKSRLSLIERSKSSWSNTDSDYYPRCSTCFIFATMVHLVAGTATCAISFYLLSKMGRRYYLDFGIIAGFINFTLGLLGFRSYCWRWLPNRNYVSGFVALAAFSVFTCAGLSYLIIVKPMAGDPILDIMGGAIGAFSVLTILLALTGLTMSGCCKTPPPDNRVADI